jgi:hypothetical protein
MSIFGREAFIEAQKKAEAFKHSKETEAMEQRGSELKALLGLALLKKTIEKVDKFANGVNLQPAKRQGEAFRRKLELDSVDSDYDTSKLMLKAVGDTASSWMHYDLEYQQPEGLEDETIGKFYASRTDHILGHKVSPSHLWYGAERVPVSYESEEYQFIRAVAGLFLPEAIKIIEGQSRAV